MASPRAPQDRQPRKTAAKKTTAPAAGTSQADRMRAGSRAVLRQSRAAASNTLTSDQLADEVEVQRPDGMPPVLPRIALRRRRKAEFTAAMAAMAGRISPAKARRLAEADLDEDGTAQEAAEALGGIRASLLSAAQITALVADVEDLLRAVAVDADDMDEWLESATDEDLMDAFRWYQQEYPEGEAEASPS